MRYIDQLKAKGLNFQWKVWEATKNGILKAGKPVTEEHFRARMAVCSGCPYKGKVNPLGTDEVELDGCEKCGCPFETKARLWNLGPSAIKCPHPTEGNKWANVDQKFKSNVSKNHF